MISFGALDKELIYTTSRSSGAGGQHVNKTETKVELRWNVLDSTVLSDYQKHLVYTKLSAKINAAHELVLTNQTERSQFRNKDLVKARFYTLVNGALVLRKKRKETKPSRASVQRRIDTKKRNSNIKKMRRRPDY